MSYYNVKQAAGLAWYITLVMFQPGWITCVWPVVAYSCIAYFLWLNRNEHTRIVTWAAVSFVGSALIGPLQKLGMWITWLLYGYGGIRFSMGQPTQLMEPVDTWRIAGFAASAILLAIYLRRFHVTETAS